MTKTTASLLVTVLLLSSSIASAQQTNPDADRNWPRWRGPQANGFAPHADPPTEWDESTNIKWKIDVPGLGVSTPVIWNDQVFILTSIAEDAADGEATESAEGDDRRRRRFGPGRRDREQRRALPEGREAPEGREPPEGRESPEGRDETENGVRRRPRGRGRFGRGSEPPTKTQSFVILSIDRSTGKTVWQQSANELVPHEGFRAGDNSFASGSPVTDGKHLYVSFGSYGLYCYDLQGNQVWNRDLGDMKTRNAFGEGASPALHGDTLVVNWDHEEQDFIVALDAASGEVKWKVERDEPTTWSTPLIVENGGRTQVITNGTNRVRSYDLENGELLWECGGQTLNAIPSPVRVGDSVVCMTGFRGNAVYSIPFSASGDVTGTDQVNWFYDQDTDYRPGTPYVPSPLLYEDLLYFTKGNNAILSCLNAHTGELVYDGQRLQGVQSIYASPVGAAGRIYIVGRDGTTIVFKHGREFEQIAANRLDDAIDASPAVVGNEIFLRSKESLYCIAEQ